MQKEDVIVRINAIEKEAQAVFLKLRDRLNGRLDDENDAMMDYEVDVTVVAISSNDDILYRSVSNILLFDKADLDDEYIKINHNDFPSSLPRGKREYHGFLYHDLIIIFAFYCATLIFIGMKSTLRNL